MSTLTAIYTKLTQCLIGFVILFLSACGNANDPHERSVVTDSGTSFSTAQNQGSATLRVIYVPAPGFAYTDNEGQVTGVTVEIMRDFKAWFERYHGVALELDFVADEDWSSMYERVSDGQGGVFGLGNVTITQERQQDLRFTPPYLYNVAVLITPADVAEISSEDAFASSVEGLEPLAFAGTLHEVRIRQLRDTYQPERDIARVNSNQAVIDGVVNGHYSYVDAYNYHRAKAQGVEVTHHSAFNLVGEQFGIIMPHSNDWHTLVTAFFAAEGGYLTTPRYAELLHTHLGPEVAEILLHDMTEPGA